MNLYQSDAGDVGIFDSSAIAALNMLGAAPSPSSVTINTGAKLVADFAGTTVDQTMDYKLFHTDGGIFGRENISFINVSGWIDYDDEVFDPDTNVLWLSTLSSRDFGDADLPLRPNAKPIPDVFDKIQKGGNMIGSDLTDAIGKLITQGKHAQAAAAFNQLPGDVFAAGQIAGADLRKSFNGLFPTYQNIYGEYVTPVTDSYRGQSAATHKACNSYWATPTGRWMERGAKGDGFYGYDLGNVGVAVGVSRQINSHNHVGLAFGYDYANLDMQWLEQRDNFHAVNLALYGGYVDSCQFYDYQIGYGKNYHNTRRVISFPGFNAATTADYDDNLFSLSLMYGRKYGVFLPSVGLEYVQVWTPSFVEAERGNRAAALRTADGSYSSVELPIGFRLNKTYRHRLAALTPELRTFWVPQVADRSSHLMTAFAAGGPKSPEFLIDTGDYGWQHFRLGSGVTARFNRRWSSSLNYDAALYSGSTRQTASFAVTAMF